MSLRIKIIFLVFTLHFITINCFAQTQKITQEYRADTVKLIKLTGALNIGQEFANKMIQYMAESIQEARPDIEPRALEIVKEETNKMIDAKLPEMEEIIVTIYHRHLTHDDIKGLLAFYESDLGKKITKKLPIITKDSMWEGEEWGRSLERDLINKIAQRLEEEGYNR